MTLRINYRIYLHWQQQQQQSYNISSHLGNARAQILTSETQKNETQTKDECG